MRGSEVRGIASGEDPKQQDQNCAGSKHKQPDDVVEFGSFGQELRHERANVSLQQIVRALGGNSQRINVQQHNHGDKNWSMSAEVSGKGVPVDRGAYYEIPGRQ
jgi:hypothetical protein